MAEAALPIEAYPVDDALARRNALVLSVAQMLYGCVATVLITTGGLVGQMLADDKALATLPISTFVIGTMLFTVPASLYMRRVGRRIGFMTGSAIGVIGSAVCVAAIWQASFQLFMLGTFMMGGYQAFSGYLRFAAADLASEAYRPRAISWVLVGGLAAAVIGPQLVIHTRDALAPLLFAGAFAVAALVAASSIAFTALVDIPLQSRAVRAASGRPVLEIMRQPRFVVAVACGMISYGIMNLVMTAGPLAIVACNFTVDDAAFVIQWHAIAMFAPSFVTGRLIARFGITPVILTGLAVLAGCGAVALSGIELEHFWLALALLGLGWNFAFVGATTMVTGTYRPEERSKIQAVNDLMVFGTVAVASLTSGVVFQLFGWDMVNLVLFPFVALAAALVVWLAVHERRVAA